MKNLKIKLANTLALSMGVIWILCALIVWMLPDFSMQVMIWWMHGLDMSALGDWDLTFGSLVYGGLTAILVSWLSGFVIGWSWEKVNN